MGVVAEAARELDERVPDWYRLIDLDKLEMSDCNYCVLGQLAKKKRWRAKKDILYSGLSPYHRGLAHFDLATYETTPLVRGTAGGTPTRYWLTAIRSRLAKDPS
jgi:hypothetical protein